MDYLTETLVQSDDWTRRPSTPRRQPPVFARHKGHINVLYGDGSVRSSRSRAAT